MAFGAAAIGHGQSIPVEDGSFEQPQADSTWNHSNPDGPYLAGDIPGWIDNFGTTGEWQPVLGPNTFAAVPDGDQLGFAGSAGEASDMYQLLGADIVAGTTYTVSVLIGNRADLGLRYGLQGYGYASLETASGTVLSSTGEVLASAGGFTLVTVSYTAGPADPNLGQQLRIDLGTPSASQASFDEVTANSTPEPVTLVAGLFTLGLVAKRRFRHV